ncbi:MAG: DNA methylase [Chloroflexi bacterium]|nr:MAG: DNA methylase [Chloroflexota bacterium]
MSNIAPAMPQDYFVKRSDPVYMAHAYLTKVPVAAIEPFIEANTSPGDIVVDPFAGSGMTGVAAAALGRRARLFDISVLGRHIGRNYVNLVHPAALQQAADHALAGVQRRLGAVYAIKCHRCSSRATLAKTVWSFLIECPGCRKSVNFYRSLRDAEWHKGRMKCPSCATLVTSKARRVGEEASLDYIDCQCSSTQLEQEPSAISAVLDGHGLTWPDVEITPDRQMYQASALGKHGLTTIASFYSPRNLAFLAALRDEISKVDDQRLRDKLLFAFTAVLTRASKRYQWSVKRPLNAANANYYVAPIFYEWNVGDLFARKIEAAIRADQWLRARQGTWSDGLFADDQPDVQYEIASADKIPLDDGSVDYVFTDPPFGSNLFYADMALFQEAWLDQFTDVSLEAVIDRGNGKKRTASRYELLLTAALKECHRILKPGGRITMVFGNSTGAIWGLVQRAVQQAALVIEPESVVILNKGQRSVKGLASGFEHVATMDLILSMREKNADEKGELHRPGDEEVKVTTSRLLGSARADNPSHLYLELLRDGIRQGWDLSGIDLRSVTTTVQKSGWTVDPGSGRLVPDARALLA